MIFQLDDLGLSESAFRVLFSIIRRAYYDKITETSVSFLCKQTKLTKYKVNRALQQLKDEKLIQVKTLSNYTLEITLLPSIIKLINLDYKRRGSSAKPAKVKHFNEIKKYRGNKKVNSSKSNSTTKSPQTGLSSSACSTTKTHPSSNSSTSTNPSPTKKPSPVIKTRKEENPRALPKYRLNNRPEYVSTRGDLYLYFRQWMQSNEAIPLEVIQTLSEEQIAKKWKQFKAYTRTWLRLQEVMGGCNDLNKIRFYSQIAKTQQAA